ncbi:DUF4880 domain-containing protein [Pseudothauera nasutitermitis]|uniref:DUF4880 domain-containing protein n=1 Tax=Pseudothauera nasutitermitis TaxID=2565930 RepID=A0A4S4B3V9_9RHOO|nr:FecR domain-containing protein [Pseudothauera nasutitermitis]THF66951.1 DUF4880 domain-containing protein [Pseudothauera nasutitermitis]
MNENDGLALDDITRDAIDWMVLLRSGEASGAQRDAFAAWQAADARHAAAWRRIAGALDGTFAPVQAIQSRGAERDGLARHILLYRGDRRRIIRGALALAGLGLGAGAILDRRLPLAQLTADLRTSTGERRSYALPDGSSVMLNARSAVDIDFSAGRRELRLRSGELIATVAPGQPAPFVVRTAHGTVRALGTRFLVRQQAEGFQVAVLEHAVAVETRNGVRHRVGEGESAWFDAGRVEAHPAPAESLAAWTGGMLEVHDEPLARVADGLRPYLGAYLRVSPEAARLRVLGVYSLDDPQAALASLAETLPLRVQYYGPWLIVVDLR